MNKDETPALILLVHGTWAPGAGWTNDKDVDGKRVRDVLGEKIGGEIRFAEPFQWSGANQWEARKQGADEFLRHLETQALECPDAKIYIIAHSNAGNLVKASLEKAEADTSSQWLDRVQGLVCLATPFFDLSEREIAVSAYSASPIWLGFMGLLAVWMGALYLLASGMEHETYTTQDWWALTMVKSGLTAVIVIGILLSRSPHATNELSMPIKTALEGMLSASSSLAKLPGSVKVLVLWTRGDEAYLGLRALQLFLAIPYLLSSTVAVLAFLIFPIFVVGICLGSIGYFIAFLLSVFSGAFFNSDFDLLMGYSAFVIRAMKFIAAGVLGSGALALGSLGLLHIVALLIRLASSGREVNGLSYGLLKLRIHRTLKGADNVPVKVSGRYWLLLRHSLPWREPTALTTIGEWIEQRRKFEAMLDDLLASKAEISPNYRIAFYLSARQYGKLDINDGDRWKRNCEAWMKADTISSDEVDAMIGKLEAMRQKSVERSNASITESYPTGAC